MYGNLYGAPEGCRRVDEDEASSAASADSELACELLHDYLSGAAWLEFGMCRVFCEQIPMGIHAIQTTSAG